MVLASSGHRHIKEGQDKEIVLRHFKEKNNDDVKNDSPRQAYCRNLGGMAETTGANKLYYWHGGIWGSFRNR